MWNRTLIVAPRAGVIEAAQLILHLLPHGKRHSFSMVGDDLSQRDIQGLLVQTKPHLAFTPEEEYQGRLALRELGIPEGAQFVCFHARDSVYFDSALANKGIDYRYHSFRDFSIHTMVPAAEELTRRGYYAIRMGAVVKEALQTTNPMIIDYATNGSRSDFLDIYLLAKCRFFITSDAGIYAVAEIFRRPYAFVNFPVLGRAHTWNPQPFIFKKLWLKAEKRFMSVREILASGAGQFLFAEQYAHADIELVENTPEEIMALTMEVDERLNGTWKMTSEDEDLQQRFWEIFKRYAPTELHGIYRTRIGAEFLRQNRELLD
jgi:putative glycosyltransferase (TIGR04372 family)